MSGNLADAQRHVRLPWSGCVWHEAGPLLTKYQYLWLHIPNRLGCWQIIYCFSMLYFAVSYWWIGSDRKESNSNYMGRSPWKASIHLNGQEISIIYGPWSFTMLSRACRYFPSWATRILYAYLLFMYARYPAHFTSLICHPNSTLWWVRERFVSWRLFSESLIFKFWNCRLWQNSVKCLEQ
jgi:hypothetical protein